MVGLEPSTGARDGEGASCLLEVTVEGADDEAGALTLARTVCGSSLVKTAIHGRDPNWGRIVAAAGRARRRHGGRGHVMCGYMLCARVGLLVRLILA